MTITLVRALTQLAWDNDRAAEQAPARLVPILQATSRAADEAARHVQFNRLDQLTERQRKMIEELTL